MSFAEELADKTFHEIFSEDALCEVIHHAHSASFLLDPMGPGC